MKGKSFLLEPSSARDAPGVGERLAGARTLPSAPATGAAGPDPAAYAAFDTRLEEHMRRLHIPGAALAVIAGERIAHLRGFGKARPGGEAPTPQTPFFIGSLSKSFTALAVMQLVEAGKVSLDAPVQRYLPWFRLADAQASAQMKVRHLLNQTSGLPFFSPAQDLTNFDDRPDAAERQVRALDMVKLSYPVGTKVYYSNLNFIILGLIVEAASGEPYARFIQTHIFDPLEMRHSYTSKAAAQENGLARGHRHWFSFPFPAPDLPVPIGSLAAGQLISCAEDMAHYLIAHLNGGCYGAARVLSAAGMEELHRGVMEYIQFGISSGKHGMGWFEINLGPVKTWSHGGNVPDFSAFMALVPGQQKGFILLLNADPYGLPPVTDEIGLDLTAVLAGQEPAPVRLDFIQWVMRLLPLVPLLQAAGAAATLRILRRWSADPASRPERGRLWGRYVLLPLLADLPLAGGLIYLFRSKLIRFLDLFMPDVAWIARISGAFAGAWAALRTALVWKAWRKLPAPPGQKEEIDQ